MNPHFAILIRDGMIPCVEHNKKRIPVEADLDTIKKPVSTDRRINYMTYTYSGYSEYNLLKILHSHLNPALEREVNKRLNVLCKTYEEKNEVCPTCGNYTTSIGNDGNYCKFCGQKLKDVPMPKEIPEIPEQITLFRKKFNLSQGELAKEMHKKDSTMSQTKLNQFEKGGLRPTSYHLYIIADVLGVSPEYLCGGNPKREQGKKPLRLIVSEHGYEWKKNGKDDEEYYIYTCPCCGEKVDLRPLEALSVNRAVYELNRYMTDDNDGDFCKYCGQELERPIEIEWGKVADNLKIYIKMILRKIERENRCEILY